MKIHLDTDLGTDTDDACALVMLLGWEALELTGVTTSIDPAGRRAGFTYRCLELAGRTEVALAAGSEVSMTSLTMPGWIQDAEPYWPGPVPARPSPPGAALDLLEASIQAGSTVVAVGPFTNLALLEICRPGILAEANIVVMGGWDRPPPAGLPQLGPEADWNVQCDRRAAQIVAAAAGSLTLVPLAATLQAHLREADTTRLEAAGALGALLASQARAWARERSLAALARSHPGLPADLLNFQHDPLACAVAAGYEPAASETVRVRSVVREEVLSFEKDESGREVRIVTGVDGEDFRQLWLSCVERAAKLGEARA